MRKSKRRALFLSSGTQQERGLIQWKCSSSSSSSYSSYDFPVGMDMVRRARWLRRFPISPSFTGFRASEEAPPSEQEEEEEGVGERIEEAADLHLPSTKVWLWCHRYEEEAVCLFVLIWLIIDQVCSLWGSMAHRVSSTPLWWCHLCSCLNNVHSCPRVWCHTTETEGLHFCLFITTSASVTMET